MVDALGQEQMSLHSVDSIVKGGLFTSALGHAPSDIILEGDDFVSPETSYAPEETVPGQLFDKCR